MNQEPLYSVYVKTNLYFLMQILSGSQALFCPLYGNQLPELRKFCLWNLESSGLESRIQLQEARVLLTTGIRNPSYTDKESQIQYLESKIHCVESRIQYHPGLPYTGRSLKGWLKIKCFLMLHYKLAYNVDFAVSNFSHYIQLLARAPCKNGPSEKKKGGQRTFLHGALHYQFCLQLVSPAQRLTGAILWP